MQVAPSLLVACLCAGWCDTCTAYRENFELVQTEFPDLRFRWIDIEDEAELVDDIDVENFPTLLIARNNQALFFGTVLPHAENLRRLIHAHHEVERGIAPASAVQALVDRLSLSPE